MAVKLEIDNSSGFCYGVIRAIDTAEKNLTPKSKEKGLYSLGAIVHNGSELTRLEKKGLQVIDLEKMKTLRNTRVLIRAHGEPPSTYALARENNITLIDCTCPVVLALQKKVASTDGQIVIYGKYGHAEVNGLVGRAEGRAVVIESENIERIAQEKIDFSRPIAVFSQTTKDPELYDKVCQNLRAKMAHPEDLTVHNTICKQVAKRHTGLREFAKSHDILIFVSGHDSSNGMVLFELCRQANPRCYHIQSLSQIDKKWFKKDDFVGICGATSTPKWQLESVRKFLKITLNNYICATFNKIIYGNYSRF